MKKSPSLSALSVLDPPDGLNLGSLGVGAELTVTLVLSSTTVALHDVLVATVPGVLIAHKAAGKHKVKRWAEGFCSVVKFQVRVKMNLRSAVNLHGSNLFVHPAHGLQRGVVVAHLELTTHHVLHLVDGHTGLLVVL